MLDIKISGILGYCADLEVLQYIMQEYFIYELADALLVDYGFNLGSQIAFVFRLDGDDKVDLRVDSRFNSNVVDLKRYMEDKYGLDSGRAESVEESADNIDGYRYRVKVLEYRGLSYEEVRSIYGYLCMMKGIRDRDGILDEVLYNYQVNQVNSEYFKFFMAVYKADIEMTWMEDRLVLKSKVPGLLDYFYNRISDYIDINDMKFYSINTGLTAYPRLYCLEVMLDRDKKAGLIHLGYTDMDISRVLAQNVLV